MATDLSKAFVPDNPRTVDVEPSDNLFQELGNNTYDYKDLLSELIDNALAARSESQVVNVSVEIHLSDSDPSSSHVIIRDDADGIPFDHLGVAISPAAQQSTNSLNEHGLGMKQAVAGLGTLGYLVTKTANDDHATVVERFGFGEFVPKMVDVDWEHGTEILISKIRAAVRVTSTSYTRDIVPYLGARYRRFLRPDNPQANIQIGLFDLDDDDTKFNDWTLKEVKPVYFHPSTRTNTPIADHENLTGPGWKAELVFGYSPIDHEWEELGLEEPSKFHPYAISLSRQGLDVILNNRVIQFHQLVEIGIVGTRHQDYNALRGEVILKEGFSTAITKNALIVDDHLRECYDQITTFLNDKGYVRGKSYPGAIPEAALRDRLAVWLSNNQIVPKEDVKKEFVVGGLDGAIDVLADAEAWEIKRDVATGYDVYQLFAYMDMGDIKEGRLLAADFKVSAEAAKDHINANHDRSIVLDKLENYPINDALSPEELTRYY
ncbi:MAG: ATP-binding protein [Chloroflexi bacterium]|nr:ATP-binding protein [Chloroflexota bacterium]